MRRLPTEPLDDEDINFLTELNVNICLILE